VQSDDGLRASMDSVLLASAISAKAGESILDMGCGTGSVGLCVNARFWNYDLLVTGIDIQDKMIDLAKKNARKNNLLSPHYICGDIGNKHLFDAEAFDQIVMNPPYYTEGKRQQSPDPAREKAYSGDLHVWISSALHWVKQGGSLALIHRADALDNILTCAKGKFGAIEVWPIYSKPQEPAIRVIVKMIRNRKTPIVIHPPIIMFDENGKPSMQSNSILRDGKGLV
jgi:tRNA1(Val) A37 N6-methylase TrmN6